MKFSALALPAGGPRSSVSSAAFAGTMRSSREMMGASSMQKNRIAPAASPRALGRSLSRFSACLLAAWSIASADEARGAAPAGAAAAAHADPWWKHAVIYEIYPRSFQDSNGDGIGDLNGIAQRLDYLEALGVDAIWIAPMYPSPQVDFGYDISDYRNVDPQYGTLADFDRLLKQARAHHIRVLLDMVLNHTSDRHPWFVEAASSRTASRPDVSGWADGKRGAGAKPLPPNNWVSLFGGSAWQYVPAVDQFYYHKFYRQQPDLNWRNPKVEQAMFGAMRFWLDRGVTGFRLDAITTLFEDPQLRDEPALGGTNAQGDPNLKNSYTDNLPEVHDVIRRMRGMIDSYSGGRLLVGETYVPNTSDLDPWYGGAKRDELQLPMDTLVGLGNKLDAAYTASLLNWHKSLIALRRSNAPLRNGRTVMLDQPNASVLTYARVAPGGETIVVALNMSGKEQSVSLGARAAGLEGTRCRTLLSSPAGLEGRGIGERIPLPPFGAWVAAVE